MKCDYCGKNEVTFVYQSSINGRVAEAHLCSECAEKLGYARRAADYSRSMMENFFGNGFLDRFFRPVFPGLAGRMLEDPFDDFFADMPALGAPAEKRRETGELVREEEQSRFSQMRRHNALKMELKEAVRQENFERAAELRDQIRALEAENTDEKESAD